MINGYLILNTVPIRKELCKEDEHRLKEIMLNCELKVLP